MDSSKEISQVYAERVSPFDYENGNGEVEQKGGTPADAQDMDRMGKHQQLQRNFKFVTIVGFVMILQFSWESVLM